jgi:hypothetical protein
MVGTCLGGLLFGPLNFDRQTNELDSNIHSFEAYRAKEPW